MMMLGMLNIVVPLLWQYLVDWWNVTKFAHYGNICHILISHLNIVNEEQTSQTK